MKHKIDVVNWNDEKGMCRGSKEEMKTINKCLQQLRASLVTCYREMTLQNKIITAETFKQTCYGKDEEKFTLCKLVKYHRAPPKINDLR